jgi:hypothetical protein
MQERAKVPIRGLHGSTFRHDQVNNLVVYISDISKIDDIKFPLGMRRLCGHCMVALTKKRGRWMIYQGKK